MKRSCFLLLILIAFCGSVMAQNVERQTSVVYIDGVKYYIHNVEQGQTAYAIAQAYGISVERLLELNPAANDGLKVDQSLRLPFDGVGERPAAESMSDKRLKKTFVMHTVAQGETLYSISRSYSISVDTILEDNTDVAPLNMSVGTVLKIRKKSIGRTDDQTAREQMEQYLSTLGAAPEGYEYYVVQPKETIYSLSRRYGMSEQEFVKLNNLTDGLKAGAVILVPSKELKPREITIGGEILVLPDTIKVGMEELHPEQSKSEDIKPKKFKALSSDKALKVALLLPLSDNGSVKASYRALYQGFLLGLEDVKRKGYSVDVALFDTQRKIESVNSITQSEDFRAADLIIGHLYPEEVSPVLEYADSCNLPVVMPLHDMSDLDSRVLFQMAPIDGNKFNKLRPLLDSVATVTLVRTSKVDSLYEQEVTAFLKANNKPYDIYQYRGAQGADYAKQGDLTPLLRKSKSHLLFVLSNNEVETDRVLASLSSARTSMRSKGMSVPSLTTVGSAKWGKYLNIDRVNFFKNNVTYTAPFYAARNNHTVRKFDSRYIMAFGSMPSQFSYRGYETAVIFCEGMFSDIENDMQYREYTPLQSTYSFTKPEGSQTNVNEQWMLIRFDEGLHVIVE